MHAEPEAELPILFRDEHLVAINKPPGLLVHRSAIDRHETRFAMQLLRDQIGEHVFPVHRLDKPTAGVLLFALDAETAKRMGEQISGRETRKTYLAIVRGWPEEAARIDYALLEEPDRLATDRRAQQDKPAQEAVTDYRRLATVELPVPVSRYPTSRYALLELQPQTGRRHQIRRHMHHIFHPIIGDTTHGEGRHNRYFRERHGVSRLLLAATELQFTHPRNGVRITLQADPGADFHRLAKAFSWVMPTLAS